MKEIFDGIFVEKGKLYTQSLVKGERFYGENILKKGAVDYREFSPERSKLAAAVVNGLKNTGMKKGTKVLYLGASTGTTCSHISDIIGSSGIIYAIEFAERVFHSLLGLAEKRKNIAVLFEDARKPENYLWVEDVDIVFCDVAQSDETMIALRNADIFLKKNGFLMIAVKSQSIDVARKPDDIYRQEKKKVEKAGYKIKEIVNLEPYEKMHALISAMK